LGRAQFSNVHVVEGTTHKHDAQKPRTIDPKTIK
jgi:ribosomal protein L13